MSLNWQENSEIVVGQLLENKIAKNCVRADLFFPPYDDVVTEILKGDLQIEDIIEKVGFTPIQTCLDAIHSLNGLGEKNWVKLLEKSKASYTAGQKLEKISKKLLRGEEINWSDISVVAEKAQAGVGGDFIPLSQIKADVSPFVPSGWKIHDEHLVGLPAAGLIVVGGQPGVGKTTHLIKMASEFVRFHKDKKVSIFSIEMSGEELRTRFDEIGGWTTEEADRILTNDFPVNADEVVNKCATVDGLGLILIDFIDMMVKDNSESEYSKVYLSLALGAKALHCPIVAYAQFVKYENGIPKPKHLRYTKMAEALSWMILMLYNPNTDFTSTDEDELLPCQKGAAYIIVWKIRGGYRNHLQDSPGAIMLAFRGDTGWGSGKSKWFSLRKRD